MTARLKNRYFRKPHDLATYATIYSDRPLMKLRPAVRRAARATTVTTLQWILLFSRNVPAGSFCRSFDAAALGSADFCTTRASRPAQLPDFSANASSWESSGFSMDLRTVLRGSRQRPELVPEGPVARGGGGIGIRRTCSSVGGGAVDGGGITGGGGSSNDLCWLADSTI